MQAVRDSVVRHPWPPLLGLVAAVAGVLLLTGGGTTRHLHADFPSAQLIEKGLRVTLSGHPVGKVDDVTLHEGGARVRIAITDAKVWPLPQGSRAVQRLGSTIGVANRSIAIEPADPKAPDLADEAFLQTTKGATPVEFDEAFEAFDPGTRTRLRRLMRHIDAAASGGLDARLGRSLRPAASGIGTAAQTLQELGSDTRALSRVVRSGAQTFGVLAAHERDVRRLVTTASRSFAAIAARGDELRDVLDQLGPTLHTSRRTMAAVDRTLVPLTRLVSAAARPARALPPLARRLNPALAQVQETVPPLNATLSRLTAKSASIRRLLVEAKPVVAQGRELAREVDPMLGCLRPYTPEIAGWFSTWADLASYFDTRGHYARDQILAPPIAPGVTTKQQTELSPLTYAMPRPPGLNAGKPWFLPECGAGPDAIDPAKDPEAP